MSYPDLVAAGPAAFGAAGEDALPDDPFTSLSYSFGQLLGKDDFDTQQSYHRSKLRLHQGWLHGLGIVWGLRVWCNVDRGEVQVEPGLALDGAGRELHLDATACLDPAAWLQEHSAEVTLGAHVPNGAEVAFDAHVVMRFASCETRSIPALADPCEGSRVESVYSRVWETVDLELVPGLAPAPAERYPRVRVLLGLRAPRDGEAADEQAANARKEVLAAPPGDRAAVALAAFRAMANADAEELRPGGAGVLTPGDPREAVVLGDIRGLALKREGERLVLAGGRITYASRRSHVQTATIQELSVALLASAAADPEPIPVPLGLGRPQVSGVALAPAAGSRSKRRTRLVVSLAGAVDKRSVQPGAFAVSALTDGGWKQIALKGPPAYDAAATPPTITLALASEPAAPWQLVVRGTGGQPIVDRAGGRLGGGADFVHIEPVAPPAPPEN